MAGLKDTLLGDEYFDHCVAPRRTSETTRAAHAAIKPHISRISSEVLNWISVRPDGATYAEVMAGLGLGAPTVTARLRELADAGRIIKTGERRPSPSGRACSVYRVRI